jgi:hypothetical protein
MGRSSREEWAKRVQRWVESGLTAPEFGAEAGLNPRTLTYWKWRLGQERAGGDRGRARGFVEVAAPVAIAAVEVETPAPLEVVLRDGVRIRVPSRFDATALKDLLAALEAR